MTTARDLMHPHVECIKEDETLDVAARRMREFDVGALPICGHDDRLHGMITDRDVVVRCIAEGLDPWRTTARELAQERVHWIEADAPEEMVLSMMEEHQIRRLPVIDDGKLVGMISEADLAHRVDAEQIAEFAARVYAPT